MSVLDAEHACFGERQHGATIQGIDERHCLQEGMRHNRSVADR